jgi:hypothetical protein
MGSWLARDLRLSCAQANLEPSLDDKNENNLMSSLMFIILNFIAVAQARLIIMVLLVVQSDEVKSDLV